MPTAPVRAPDARGDGEVLDFDARLLLLVGEARAELEFGLGGGVVDGELAVLVIGRAEPEADRIDARAAHPPLALRLHLVLHHVDARVDALLRLLARDAIEAGKARVRHAEETVGADERGAKRGAVTLDEAVEHRAARRSVVVGLALEGVCVDGEAAGAGGGTDGSVGAVIDRRVAAEDAAGKAAARDEGRDAFILHRDDAADGL